MQNPSINGYIGGFGYNLASGVTIVVEATKREETTTTDASAFDILREVVKYVTPASPTRCPLMRRARLLDRTCAIHSPKSCWTSTIV